MKILIHSNSPATFTGYGVQTALLAERLHDAGYEVAISDDVRAGRMDRQLETEEPPQP